MSYRLPSLLYRSSKLQQQIEAEQMRPSPSWLRLMRLKRLRLKLMERLHRASRAARLSSLGNGSLQAC